MLDVLEHLPANLTTLKHDQALSGPSARRCPAGTPSQVPDVASRVQRRPSAILRRHRTRALPAHSSEREEGMTGG